MLLAAHAVLEVPKQFGCDGGGAASRSPAAPRAAPGRGSMPWPLPASLPVRLLQPKPPVRTRQWSREQLQRPCLLLGAKNVACCKPSAPLSPSGSSSGGSALSPSHLERTIFRECWLSIIKTPICSYLTYNIKTSAILKLKFN